jgi:hypothetical protein
MALVPPLDVLPKGLPFYFIAPPFLSFWNYFDIFYSTLMGIFERLLGPNLL